MQTILVILCLGIIPYTPLKPIVEKPTPKINVKAWAQTLSNMAGIPYEDDSDFDKGLVQPLPPYTNQPIRLSLVASDLEYYEIWQVEARVSQGFILIGTICVYNNVYFRNIFWHFSDMYDVVLYENIYNWKCRAMSIDGKVNCRCEGLPKAVDLLMKYYKLEDKRMVSRLTGTQLP